MRVAILSDIHGNLEAFKKVCEQIRDVDKIVLLGDIIDYGQHSNEVISLLESMDDKVICSIWGNHEDMILNDNYSSFDLERGVLCAKHTQKQLTEKSVNYLKNYMTQAGSSVFEVDHKKYLAIHGSFAGPYWQPLTVLSKLSYYCDYDYVLSGHTHIPHLFDHYSPCEDPERRNKKRTVFINPGSVGQPRNHMPLAQFAIFDTNTEEITFKKVQYDIAKEQEAFDGEVDDFYRVRLQYGV